MNARTLVIIKPDAFAAGHVGSILRRYEEAGLRILAMERRTIGPDFADLHYAEHVGRDYYLPLRKFMTEGPLVAVVLEGEDAIRLVRTINGATDPAQADEGTIRADLAESHRRNAVHASDSEESAEAEIALWFPDL
ncbi:nucleoside diphosphate kinase [Tessaracoccus bendigoensis DSM 12906]|uniref:Nucleoside diphosphate kinase n=1 Tax=Tessaracoccus bendigoensis DSM 12906 TaxID=1123357 RepID=A0A1M6BYR9_9ACTN|nr:nucleoside-diphosphate kinase [Tessaracoccus bendigoensis]SHI53857.1 nucleoside diphosphate kinase [Tessaracoccus bendigoensis DSM 12906]